MPSLQTTYIVIDPLTGRATGLFTGGILIPVELDGAIGPGFINFTDAATGVTIARVFASYATGAFGPIQRLVLGAQGPDPVQDRAQLILETTGDVEPAEAVVTIIGNGNLQVRLLVDENGGSDFVQVGVPSGGTPPSTEARIVTMSWAIPALGAGLSFTSTALDTGHPFAGAAFRVGFGSLGSVLYGTPSYALSNVGGNLAVAVTVNNVSGSPAGAGTLTGVGFVFYNH